jgi:DNA-binding MarR family transcriptional regulator
MIEMAKMWLVHIFAISIDIFVKMCYTMPVLVENSTIEREKMEERFETFSALIAKISRNIRKIKNREVASYKLRSSHASCLYYLYTIGALTATELCEHCEEDKATISRSLDHLEKNAFVICESKAAKRYKAPFRLTEKGKEAAKRIADRVDLVLKEIDAGQTPEERLILYHSLSRISNLLEKIESQA